MGPARLGPQLFEQGLDEGHDILRNFFFRLIGIDDAAATRLGKRDIEIGFPPLLVGFDFLFLEAIGLRAFIRTLSGAGKAFFGSDIENQCQLRNDAINRDALQRLDEIRLQIAGRA
ncbi:hypothetical protein C241_02584 [Bradyrhizobium lupini HPC(L)]|uniref:Uncharacterized protein n=1 Tax=Bradyrhizobium lupini HPC(L) TaxID=1229491 RepID=A0ABN0HRH3_RHILU|nr:hypothetical protein C241_02584 [Bradyrhizobium lupini HPC(L)]